MMSVFSPVDDHVSNEVAEALAHYSDVVVQHGPSHPEAVKFYDRHRHNQQFVELADEVKRLEKLFRRRQCYTPSIPASVLAFIQSMIRAVIG